MTKEEYAQLHYLLAKLKYSMAEISRNVNNYELLDESINKINDIQRLVILPESNNNVIKLETMFDNLEAGDVKNEE